MKESKPRGDAAWLSEEEGRGTVRPDAAEDFDAAVGIFLSLARLQQQTCSASCDQTLGPPLISSSVPQIKNPTRAEPGSATAIEEQSCHLLSKREFLQHNQTLLL